MVFKLFRLSVNNLVHQKRRSWLTIIGIFIGIASVVALVSLGQGLENSLVAEFEKLGADKVFVESSELSEDDIAVIDQVRGVETVTGLYQTTEPVSFDGQTGYITIVGIPTEEKDLAMTTLSLSITAGRNVRGPDRTSIAISETLASSTFDSTIYENDQLEIAEERYRVVGTYEATGDPSYDTSILMPRDRVQEVFGENDDVLSRLTLVIDEGINRTDFIADVEQQLREDRGQEEGEENFDVYTPQDILDSFQNVIGLVQAIVLGIASISLLVGGIGIMNTMYTAVTERTREIGIMKAIGATDRQIQTVFLFESGILGLIGGIVGVGVGLGLSFSAAVAADTFTTVPVGAAVSLPLVGGAILFSFLTGAVSGVLPARKAANLEPVDALRQE
ncbi:MAG: ABC transporter permease [Candidatus Nanohaloarchaeota archaeon QJJ-5]|nr:ABC transporter permease [Candidatus Nanohaloarchaeota archaeon QJJ-5]